MSKRSRRDPLSTLLSPPIANQRLPRYTVSNITNNYKKIPIPDLYRVDLRLIEDRRTYTPELARPVVGISVSRGPARLVAKQNPAYKAPSQTKALVAFAEPKKLALCVRRGIRKEVLFAKGVGGSKKPQRAPRKSEFSDISCK